MFLNFPLKESFAVIAALIGSIGVVLSFLKWYLPWRKKQKIQKTTIQQMRSIQKVYELMSEQLNNTNAERVVIFAGHNSGNTPKVGTPYYTSAIYWKLSHKTDCEDTNKRKDRDFGIDISDYKEIKVDGHYIDMLLTAYDRKHMLIETKEMPECQLKGYYEAESVVESLVVFLGFVGCNFIYMSIATLREEGFTKCDLTNIKLKASNIATEITGSD